MQEIIKTLRLSKIDYYHTHLSIVNCLLPRKMTPKEIEVLAAFMSLEGAIALHRFGPTAKKLIMQELKLSPAGLSNYITSLTDKGFLIKTGDITNILPLLIPEEDVQYYKFRLINNEIAVT